MKPTFLFQKLPVLHMSYR